MNKPLDAVLVILLPVLFACGCLLVGYMAGRHHRHRRPVSDRRHFRRIARTYPETARDRERRS